MISEPLWLNAEDVIIINRRIVERTAEPHRLLNASALEGALGRPVNAFLYGGADDIVVLASRLLFGIAHNHPFIQGNKRTGFHAALVFLRWNGYRLAAPPEEETVGLMITEVLNREMTEDQFVERIRPYVESSPTTG
jgi:death on curing protein